MKPLLIEVLQEWLPIEPEPEPERCQRCGGKGKTQWLTRGRTSYWVICSACRGKGTRL